VRTCANALVAIGAGWMPSDELGVSPAPCHASAPLGACAKRELECSATLGPRLESSRDRSEIADEQSGGDAQHPSGPGEEKRAKKSDASHAPTLEELERDLRAPRPEKRRGAVKKLAALDQRAAWELVIKSLADPEGVVADEAEMCLAAIHDAKLVAELIGAAGLESRKTEVRARVAEAFGRMRVEIDGSALARSIACSDADLSRTIAWSIERLALAKKLGGLHASIQEKLERIVGARCDSSLRGVALQALTAIDAPAAHALVQAALLEKDPVSRCAGLLATRVWTEVECTNAAQMLLVDPEASVRAQAIENLEHLSSRPAILLLIAHMEIEKRERLRYGILAFLRQRSGLALGFDSAAWKEWAQKIAGAVSTGDAAQGIRLGPVGDTRCEFAGLNVISDRVCFLVDCSGSLQTKVGGKTRKEIADEKLARALEALPADTQFNVIPYTGQPFPWEKRLEPSRPENVKRAREYFESFHQTGSGDFYGAVQAALADPSVDTIVVLTDGAPTGGKHWNLDLMFDLLVEQNRFRKVAFDSILVDATKTAQKKWSDLAQRTGGRSITAELK
jgi:HEAT repeat protein